MDNLRTTIKVEEIPISQESFTFSSLLDILTEGGYLNKAKEMLRSKKEEETHAQLQANFTRKEDDSKRNWLLLQKQLILESMSL